MTSKETKLRLVVGYTSNRRGDDAIKLASTLAGSRSNATIDIVVILPPDAPTFDMYSPDRAFHAEMENKAQEWLNRAAAQIPESIEARGHVVRAESVSEGLIQASMDPELGGEADILVLGPSKRSVIGRFSLGAIASSLLHSSPVPVALAPVGYEPHPEITRITCATGTRPGAEALVELAIEFADRWHVPLRLMSLLAVGKGGSKDARHEQRVIGERHVQILVDQANSSLSKDVQVTGVVGTGKSLEGCVRELEFSPSEIVMVGSSRLAPPKRLFLGASANAILHALPVPMIVVPRDYEVHDDA